LESDENEIKLLKEKAEAEEDVYRKEEIYNEIDKIEKSIGEKVEKKLDELLPRAFAIVKETARRFKEYSELEVTARHMTGSGCHKGKHYCKGRQGLLEKQMDSRR
jgi:preprotein translocase subunit SecA